MQFYTQLHILLDLNRTIKFIHRQKKRITYIGTGTYNIFTKIIYCARSAHLLQINFFFLQKYFTVWRHLYVYTYKPTNII